MLSLMSFLLCKILFPILCPSSTGTVAFFLICRTSLYSRCQPLKILNTEILFSQYVICILTLSIEVKKVCERTTEEEDYHKKRLISSRWGIKDFRRKIGKLKFHPCLL